MKAVVHLHVVLRWCRKSWTSRARSGPYLTLSAKMIWRGAMDLTAGWSAMSSASSRVTPLTFRKSSSLDVLARS